MASTRFTVAVYTRHSSACSRKADPYWRRCQCPKWLYINENGERTQRSARTRSWDRADEQRRSLERQFELLAFQGIASGGIPPKPQTTARTQEGPITLASAVAKFLAAKRKENLAESTMSKLTAIFERQLLTWAGSEHIDYVERVGVAELEQFRETWADAPLARKKKQERVIGFFYYCVRLGWIKSNPAALLGRIKVKEKPTDYFPKDEFEKIIQATYIYSPKAILEFSCQDQTRRDSGAV